MNNNGSCPITGLVNCADRSCELHYMDAPVNIDRELSAAELEALKEYRWYENALTVVTPDRDYLD